MLTRIYQGALIYYMRRVLHDWNDHDCVRIVQNIAGSMDQDRSRMLICDQVIETNADIQSAFYDMVSQFSPTTLCVAMLHHNLI